jgi:signal transduction histidine kinase
MAVPDTDFSFVSSFADYVRQQKDTIGRTWMQLVRDSPDVPGAAHISHEALEDHVPHLLDNLMDLLLSENEGVRKQAAHHSRTHGREQWRAGYNISELIWEIYIIRQVLTQTVLADFAREHPQYSAEQCARAANLIHDFFHRVTCESVGQFVEEQQRALQDAHQKLQQTTDSRDRLTRTVAHELRNVLNALTLATKLLSEEVVEAGRQEMSALCARMLSDMAGILNDLLDYSALVAGRSQLTVERFSLPALFEEIVAEWKPVAEEQGLEFESKCDSALGEIVSDRLKLKQIAGNLLSNAIKYRKPSKKGYVGISFTASGETSWQMIIVDTGIGIAPEDLKVLFGEFSRVSVTSNVAGTGLGLAICKEFSELLGGRVDVRSEAAQGARFEVTLARNLNTPAAVDGAGDPDPRAEIADSGQPPFQLF